MKHKSEVIDRLAEIKLRMLREKLNNLRCHAAEQEPPDVRPPSPPKLTEVHLDKTRTEDDERRQKEFARLDALIADLEQQVSKKESRIEPVNTDGLHPDIVRAISLQNVQMQNIFLQTMMSQAMGAGMPGKMNMFNYAGYYPGYNPGYNMPNNHQPYAYGHPSIGGPEYVDDRSKRVVIENQNPSSKRQQRSLASRRRWKRSIISIIFLVSLRRDMVSFRRNPRQIGAVLQKAQAEWMSYIKERQGFYKAVEIICQLSRDGVSLSLKDIAASSNRKKAAATLEKISGICNLIMEAVEKLTFAGLMLRFSKSSPCARVLEYFRTRDIRYPSDFLWSLELKALSQDALATATPRHRSKNTSHLLIIHHVIIKTLLLKILLSPIDSGILKRPNATAELNLAVIAVTLHHAVQISCGLPSNTESAEFSAAISSECRAAMGSLPSSLASSVVGWGTRMKDWYRQLYFDAFESN